MSRVGAGGTAEETDDSTESSDALSNVYANSPVVNGVANPGYTAAWPESYSNGMNGASAHDAVINASNFLGMCDLVVSLMPSC